MKGLVLVMDDEAMIRSVTKHMLNMAGCEVLLAKNGQEAIAIYREQMTQNCSVDLCIMDLTIPSGMGGKEAVKEILRINPKARVVVASGYSNDPVMAQCEKYGFCASISKPYQISELSALLAQFLPDEDSMAHR
jgi:two-component system, cell cycle sensor histidine kinase and response regulator CckA